MADHGGQLLDEAMDIVAPHSEFASDFKEAKHFVGRLVYPIRTGQLRILHHPDGRLLYTWSRLDEPCFTVPGIAHWRTDGSMLWLCDMVYDKGLSARTAGNMFCNDILDLGIGKEGERVYFYRGYSERYGYGILRRKRIDGIEGQDNHVEERPLCGHARLAEEQLEGAHADG